MWGREKRSTETGQTPDFIKKKVALVTNQEYYAIIAIPLIIKVQFQFERFSILIF